MRIFIALFLLLAGLQGIGWWACKASQEESEPLAEGMENIASEKANESRNSDIIDLDLLENQQLLGELSDAEEITYPIIQIEEVDGIVERTIHMGVRQWAWDPFELSAEYGDKVRLVIHNADVFHSIEIPELKVSAAIPEEGAVVEFMADKRGSFRFSCGATHCGKDHDKMRGVFLIK